MLAVADTCIAAQNAVVAAESLGIGSCYIATSSRMRRPCATPCTWPPVPLCPSCMLVVWPPHGAAAAPPQARPLCRAGRRLASNVYTDRTPDELRADFAAKAAANGQLDYDFDKAVQAFCKRK